MKIAIILVHLSTLLLCVANEFQYFEVVDFGSVAKFDSEIYLPSSSSSRQLRVVSPDLSKQTKEEAQYLNFHRCRDSGEAYGAAYLITKDYLLQRSTEFNLSMVNCEMGTFVMVNGGATSRLATNINGTIDQSLDILDFSVIHLSAYERLVRRWHRSIPKDIVRKGSILPIEMVSKYLKSRAINKPQSDSQIIPQMNRTVIVMPFLGSDMGAGHSKLNNRLEYLKACFWSFYYYYPHIVAFVKSEKDQEFARTQSELPFYDVVLAPNLPKSASLPVATVQLTKQRILTGVWNFDYVFFTESDQILIIRRPSILYDHLSKYAGRLILPHRLMPYPEEVMTHRYSMSFSPISYNSSNHLVQQDGQGPLDWEKMNCCLPRQNCRERVSWVHVSNRSVSILNIFGLHVALGNMDFHRESLRHCALNPQGSWNICP